MGLESATHVNQLVSTNPLGTDSKSQGDDHIRLIKSTLVTDFPNVGGIVSATHTDLSKTVKLTSGLYAPTFNNLSGFNSITPITSFHYMRIEDIVYVNGIVLVDVSSAGTLTADFNIPIARAANWGDANSAVGIVFSSFNTGFITSVTGTTDKVRLTTLGGSDGSWVLNFSYKLVG